MSARDIAIALIIVAIWGVNFVALRVGLNGVPPLLLVCLRFLLCALPAVLVVRRPKTPLRHVFWYGIFIGVIQYSLLYGALKLGMPAGLSSIVIQTQAFFTLGFAALLLKERVRPQQMAGMLIACAGLSLIALNDTHAAALVPLLMVLGAAASWGAANVVVRKAGDVDMLSLVVWGSLVPPIPMLALSLIIEGPEQIGFALTHLAWTTVAAMLFTAYLSTLVGFGLWNRLIRRYGASQVAPFSLLVPIFGLLSTAAVLGEQITPTKLLAGVLVMAGLMAFVFGGRIWARLSPTPRPA